MVSFATLCLGTRKDAITWEEGCKNLGFTQALSVRKPRPSIEELAAFFACGAEWLYIGGHFSPNHLYNENGDTDVEFRPTSVLLKTPSGSRSVSHADSFNLHQTARVIVWGGCSVAGVESTVTLMRQLFGEHVLLGFAGLTGTKMVDAMLGGGFIKNNFFKRVKNNTGWTGTCDGAVKAWMDTAAAGYGGGSIENKFRAVDWEGNGRRLTDGKVVGAP